VFIYAMDLQHILVYS